MQIDRRNHSENCKKTLIILGILLILTCSLSCIEYVAYCIMQVESMKWLFYAMIILALTLSGFNALILNEKLNVRSSISYTLSYSCMLVALFLVKYYINIFQNYKIY